MRIGTVLFVLIAFVVIPTLKPVSAQDTRRHDLDIIAAINQWRIDQNLWPLKVNDQLNQLALEHAQYLMTLPSLPDGADIHKDKNGGGPKDRAVAAHWPAYGRSDRTSVEEIAYEGHNETAAITFWNGDKIHHDTALNPAYREIGAAALPSPDGYLYIVEFGGRPDVLPTLADPSKGLLYLSNESYWGAQNSTWISNATQIRLFDADGKPLSQDWQPWQATLPIPANAGDRIYVMYSNGTVDVLSEVDLSTDLVLLPGNEYVAAAAPSPSTGGTTASNGPGAPAAAATSAPAPLSTAVIVAPQPTAVLSPTSAQATQSGAAILLVYSPQTLALINMSGKVLDLSNLQIVQGSNTLSIKRWQTPYLGAPLNAFPPKDCLQVWSWSEPSDLPVPTECRIRRGVINVAPDARFWGTGTFDVQWNGSTLITCDSTAHRCEFSLPSGS